MTNCNLSGEVFEHPDLAGEFKTTYTINGKEYTEFDINKRCAELMAWESEPDVKSVEYENGCFWVEHVAFTAFLIDDYCKNPSDTWPIIEKCWDDLMSRFWSYGEIKWHDTMLKYKCSKLVAACICFIEVNG